MKLSLLLILTALVPVGTSVSQHPLNSTKDQPTFDVVSVRQNKSGVYPPVSPTNVDLGNGNLYAPTGGRFSAKNVKLIDYIAFAYKLSGNQQQILKNTAPKWVTTDRFDIQARSEDASPAKDQMRLMMRSLLADRFKLAVHTETRQLPVFALVLSKRGKLGPQLRMHQADDPVCPTNDAGEPLAPGSSKLAVASDGFPQVCGWITYVMPIRACPCFAKAGRNVSMALLASSLLEMGESGLDRPVIDKTGLNGTVDFKLEVEVIPGYATPDYRPDVSQWFLEELSDQLGLKLEKQIGSVDVVLIDHIEAPSEN